MIGRMAHIKYQGTSLEEEPLHIRVEYVLDDLLVLVEATRRDVPLPDEVSSDSDDDY